MTKTDYRQLQARTPVCDNCGNAPQKYRMRYGLDQQMDGDEVMYVCFTCRQQLFGQGWNSQRRRWILEGAAPNLWSRNEWAKETLTDYLGDMLDGETFVDALSIVFGRDRLRWPPQLCDLIEELKLDEEETSDQADLPDRSDTLDRSDKSDEELEVAA